MEVLRELLASSKILCCSICSKKYEINHRNPVVLSGCGHTICNGCFTIPPPELSMQKGGQVLHPIRCNICQTDNTKANFKPTQINQTLVVFLKALKERNLEALMIKEFQPSFIAEDTRFNPTLARSQQFPPKLSSSSALYIPPFVPQGRPSRHSVPNVTSLDGVQMPVPNETKYAVEGMIRGSHHQTFSDVGQLFDETFDRDKGGIANGSCHISTTATIGMMNDDMTALDLADVSSVCGTFIPPTSNLRNEFNEHEHLFPSGTQTDMTGGISKGNRDRNRDIPVIIKRVGAGICAKHFRQYVYRCLTCRRDDVCPACYVGDDCLRANHKITLLETDEDHLQNQANKYYKELTKIRQLEDLDQGYQFSKVISNFLSDKDEFESIMTISLCKNILEGQGSRSEMLKNLTIIQQFLENYRNKPDRSVVIEEDANKVISDDDLLDNSTVVEDLCQNEKYEVKHKNLGVDGNEPVGEATAIAYIQSFVANDLRRVSSYFMKIIDDYND